MNRYKLGRKTKRGLAFLLSLVIAIGVLTPMLDTTASAAYVEFEELQVHQTSAPLSGSNYRNLSLNPGALNTEMRFTWHSGSPTGSIIIANPGGADWVLESTGRLAEAHAGIGIMGDTSYLLPTRPGFVYYVHQVSVYNLAPNTQYNYVVTWEGGQSGSKSFRTGGNDNFSFIIAGDPQIGTGDGLAPTSAMVEAAVDGAEWASAISIADAHAENAEFILSVGDQVHTAGGGPADFRHVRISQYRHDRMFSPSELQRLPLMAVVGNHDGWSFDDNNANPRLWPMHYNIPAPDAIGAFDQNNGGVPTVFRHATRFYTQFDYWVVWGNTLFLVLDSNVRTMSGGRLDFLNAAVVANEDNVDWIVAVYHHPAYCVYRARNIAEKNEVVANWIPHFERLGVDIVLNGHAHVYNRTFHMLNNAPIKDQYWLNAAGEVQEDETGLLYNAVLDPEGIVYFVFNSASGSGYYNVSNMPRSYIAAYNQNFRRNFSVADVTPDMFSIRTYQINDNGPPSLVDVYTIVRSDDGAVPSSVLPLPQMTEQVFERFTQPDDLENVLHPGDVIVTAEMLGLPDTIGVETNLFNNVGGNIGNIRPPNAQAAPTSYGTVVRTPRAYVKWDVEDSDFDPNDIDAQEFYVRGYIHELPDGISVPAELLPYRIYIGVSVLPYGVRPVGDIARWMQYPPGHTNHPLGMEAYFASHGVSGLNVRRPQVYRTGGEAEPLQFWANNEQRMFNWEAGAPNVTQNLVSGGGVGSSGSGLHNVTGEAYWVTRVSTEGQAGVEVQFNMRSDATGPRDWQLQFSIDGDNWADAGDPVILSGFWDNNIIRVLPAAADDQQNLYIRWIMTSNTAPNGGAIVAAGRHHMRDIIIRSTVMPGGELPGDDEHTRIDILMFNDFHGHISHGRPDDNNPGAARLSAYIQYLRQQNPTSPDNVIVVAGGDDFHGYAVSTLLGGAPTITMMEELANNSPNQDYFQVAFGNHELSFGLARAMEIGTDYGIELLAADLVYGVGHPTGTAGEHPDFIRPYSIISFDNDGEEISIALVGLMTSTMGTVVGGWDSMNFHARTPAPGAPNLYTQIIADLIEHIRDYYGVATVVGLTHKPAEAPSMLYIARELDFDAIFGAHRHARVQHVYAGVPIIEAASHGRALGRFSLNFNDQGELVNVVPWISPVNAIRDFSRDRAEMAGVEEYYDRMTDLMEYYTTNPEVSSYLNDPRGPIGIYFDTRANRDMWSSRLVLDYVVRWAEEHDDELDWIGVSNSGGWRNTGQWPRNASDNVNYADLLSTMPFDNNLLLFEMHGIDVVRLLENAGVQGNVVRTGVHQVGNNWYVTSSGERITFDRNNTYNVIASNFVFGGVGVEGGDRFPLPGNYHGDAANMQILGEPRVVMRRLEGQTDAEFSPYITWSELTEISYSSADWAELGVVMIRDALVDSTEFRHDTANTEWQAELTVVAESGGTAVITAPFAPGNRSRNMNVIPQWVTVTASGADFRGWFNVGDPANAEPVSDELVYSFAIQGDTHLEARFGVDEDEPVTIAAWASANLNSSHGYPAITGAASFAPRWDATLGLLSDPGNARLNFAANDVTRTLAAGSGGINAGSALDGMANNAYWITRISTEDLEDITVDWSLRSTNTGPRDWQLQYSIDGTAWNDVGELAVIVNAGGTNPVNINVASHFSRVLPASAEGHEILYLRWLMTSNAGVNGNPIAGTGTHQIGNVHIWGNNAQDDNWLTVREARDAAIGETITVRGIATAVYETNAGFANTFVMQDVDPDSPWNGIHIRLLPGTTNTTLAGDPHNAHAFVGHYVEVTGIRARPTAVNGFNGVDSIAVNNRATDVRIIESNVEMPEPFEVATLEDLTALHGETRPYSSMWVSISEPVQIYSLTVTGPGNVPVRAENWPTSGSLPMNANNPGGPPRMNTNSVILNPIPAGFNAGDWVIIESAYVHYWNARTEVQLRNHTIVPYVPTTVEPDDGIRVDILAFNDFHGRVDPPSRTFVGGEPGAARWAAYAEWLRQENPNPDNVLIFGAGDDFHGGAASNLSIIQGTNVARVFENMGVSHIALGNHEFSFGQERTYTLGQDYDFYLMSACFFYAEGQPNAGQRPAFAKPYDVIEFEDGVVLGVFGLSNPNMRGLVSGGLPNFDIRMPGPGQPQAYSDAIHEIIERLREYYEVDAVVGLTHIGGNHATMNYLADYFDVDALIGGHSHGRINRVRNGVPIIESGQHGNSFGRLSFYFCEDGELDEVTGWLTPVNAARDFGRAAADQDEGVVVTRTTAGFASEAENLAAFESVRWRFEEVEAIVDYWEAIASQILDVEAGPIGVYFDDRTGRDTWITRLLVDYVNRATDQNDWVAVTNTGGWRNTGLWPRDADDGATMRDFQVTMPFNNIILLFEMYGRDLIRLVNRDRPGMMGSYNTGVHRVGNTWYITATNQPITQDGIYNVIGSNFVWNARGANGGDGFPWPGNNFGNEMGMTFINYPRALLWDGTEVVFDNEFTRSSADWESMGLVNLRYSLFAETQWRSENTNWSVGLDVSATASGSAVITSPFAPGDRTATRVASPSWATVQATASGNAEFLGWFHAGAPANAEPVSTALIHSFVIREDKQLEARFYGDAIAVVDRTELKAALDAAALLDAANYTAESWAVLASAVAAGYEVYNNVNATQQAINSAATAIIEAIASLEPEALPPVEFTGSNPNNLLAQLQTRDAVLNTRGNLGIFANHGSFTIPAGRTLTVETALNIHRGAELIVEGTLIIAAGGRLNNQGVGSKITIAYGGELIVYGWVENVSGSTFTSAGEIIINDTARVNIRAGVFFCIEEYGIVTVHSPGILNINRDAIRITEE